MTEMQELWQTLLRASAVIAYAFLYARGGRGQIIIRRIGAPLAFIAISLFFCPISWKTLSLLALAPPLFLGYGGGEYEKRVIYAIVSGLAGAFACFIHGSNGMAVFQFLLTVFSTCYLGVLNPVKAVREEFLIASLSVIGVAFTL
jgi:hypothetical protein